MKGLDFKLLSRVTVMTPTVLSLYSRKQNSDKKAEREALDMSQIIYAEHF